jgi:hypothetical protein
LAPPPANTESRLSVMDIMGLVLMVAVACAALTRPSELAVGLLITLVIGVLCLSICRAVLENQGRRAFWLGFSVFGWVYVTLTLGLWTDRWLEPSLLTTKLIDWLYESMIPQPRSPRPDVVVDIGPWMGERDYIRRVGHAILSLIFGMVGGLVAWSISSRARERNA